MNNNIQLRHATPEDQDAVAALILQSTNAWYQAHGHSAIFPADPSLTRIFCDVYEEIDPGRCLLAVARDTGQIVGSCFYHPRELHVSLGIMNSHPDRAGKGVARALLQFILEFARAQGKPLRLVSSAMNLDSFSLYNRAGLTPYAFYQDMFLEVPTEGLEQIVPEGKTLRDATPADIDAMVTLEHEVLGIRRADDFRHFITNRTGLWHISVLESAAGAIDGFLASIFHPAMPMLGPGCMRGDQDAIALLRRELDARRGKTMVWLIPTNRHAIASHMYGLGARNCELHLGQTTGAHPNIRGVVFPTFMPESA